MGRFAKACKSKTVSRIQKEPTTDSNTESWPEINHIQSVNGINRIDFYKAILLVQRQPIEFIVDTDSPVTIIPPIISPIEIHKSTKSFVDVNKNPIKFKGEAMVEVKTEWRKEVLPILITENKSPHPCWDWIGWTNWKLDYKETKHEYYPTYRNWRKTTEDHKRIRRIIQKQPQNQRLDNRHPTEKKDTKPIQQKGRPVPIYF